MSVWENLSGLTRVSQRTRDGKRNPRPSAPAGDSPRAFGATTQSSCPPGSSNPAWTSVVVDSPFCGPHPGLWISMPSRKAGGPISFQRERGGAGENQFGDLLSCDRSQKDAVAKVTSGQDEIVLLAVAQNRQMNRPCRGAAPPRRDGKHSPLGKARTSLPIEDGL